MMERVDWIAHECFEQAVLDCFAQFFVHGGLGWIESSFHTSPQETVQSVHGCPTRESTPGLASLCEPRDDRVQW